MKPITTKPIMLAANPANETRLIHQKGRKYGQISMACVG